MLSIAGDGDGRSPLLAAGDLSVSPPDERQDIERTGSLWTAVAHILTAVIGAGVLSLAWSVAQLGWIGGPLAILGFAGITTVQSCLLADCYRSPDPETGHIRNQSYVQAVKNNLGEKKMWISMFFQQSSAFGLGLAYIITASKSMSALTQSIFIHKEGREALFRYGDSFYILLFGATQIVFSQIADLHSMGWLSIVATISAFTYSSIGFWVGLSTFIENGTIKGGPGGISMPTIAEKLWRVCQALGDIQFSYPISIVILQIEDTLRSPPPENKTMKRALITSGLLTVFFYLCCGCFGYAAFGDDTPGNLLAGNVSYKPHWIVDLANVCIVIHLVGGYQIFSQPIFSAIEEWSARTYPDSEFVNKSYKIKLPCLPSFEMKTSRLCFRALFVASATIVAVLFPYFNQVLAVFGAFTYWPIAIYFPVEMYFVQRKIGAWKRKWVALQCFSVVCLLLSIVAFIGSLQGILSERLG